MSKPEICEVKSIKVELPDGGIVEIDNKDIELCTHFGWLSIYYRSDGVDLIIPIENLFRFNPVI